MSSLGSFTHEPLSPAGSSIRLVQIQPGRSNDTIRCKLKHVPLEENHACLSYICGNPDGVKKTIFVNDLRYEVLPNLWAFLSIARELKITDWLWIDAISIHQTNLQERNQQVRQMSNIYRQARYVIVWPGQWPRKSPAAYENRIAAFYHWRDPVRGILWKRYWKKLYDTLASLEYFNRVWIMQELVLAGECSIILGDRIIPWRCISRFVRTYANELEEANRAYQDPPVVRLAQQTDPRDGRPISNEMSLLLKDAVNGRCSEPRDHLYAILGLIDDRGEFPVMYERPLPHILLECIEYFQFVLEYPGGFGLNHHIFARLALLNSAFGISCGCACESCTNLLSGELPIGVSMNIAESAMLKNNDFHGVRRNNIVTSFSIASQELLSARTSHRSWPKPFDSRDSIHFGERQCGICARLLIPQRSSQLVQGAIRRLSPEHLLIVIYS